MRRALACSAPAIVLALLALLPFLGKAFTIDDVTFLLQAQHVLTDPLHPTAFDMVFHGERLRLSRDLVTGPVMAYLLVPTVVSGGPEWLAHVMQGLLLALGVFSTAALALRLGLDRVQARFAAVLVAVSPAVLGMASTVMPDVPAMVFAVAGVERLVSAKQDGRAFDAWFGAILLGIAALARPHAVLVFPCAALLLTDVGTLWRGGARAVLRQWLTPPIVTLAVGLLFWGAVIALTRDPLSGTTVTSTSIRRFAPSNVAFNLASFCAHWSVGLPLAVLWTVFRGRDFLTARHSLLGAAAGLLLVVSGRYLGFGVWFDVAGVLLVCYGLAVLVDVAAVAWHERDERVLALVAWLLIGAATAGYVQLPEKVLVISAPAMALLLASRLDASRRDRRTLRWIGATVAACVVIGVLVMRADAVLAEIGREGGKVVADRRARGERVWFDGGWGFQWYAMQAGGTPLAYTAPLPVAGDVVVAGLTARLVGEFYPRKTLLDRRVFGTPGGRVLSEGAGYYGNRAGPLPWVWGTREIGRIETWRIDAPMRAR